MEVGCTGTNLHLKTAEASQTAFHNTRFFEFPINRVRGVESLSAQAHFASFVRGQGSIVVVLNAQRRKEMGFSVVLKASA